MQHFISDVLRELLRPIWDPSIDGLGRLAVRAVGLKPTHDGMREGYVGMAIVLVFFVALISYVVLAGDSAASDCVR